MMEPAYATGSDRLNKRLAWLLGSGSWLSCVIIAAGMMLPTLGMSIRLGADVVSVGIILLIALPTIRVATMSIWFLFHRDFGFAFIAGLVLAIIIASTLLGIGGHGPAS